MTKENGEVKTLDENIEIASQETVIAPVKAAKKLPKAVLPSVIIGGIVLVVIIALVAVKAVMSSPKRVFTNAINGVYKEVSNTLKESENSKGFDFNADAMEASISLKANSNIDLKEDLNLDTNADLSNVEVKVNAGIDKKNEKVIVGGSIKGDSETINGELLVTDSDSYIKTSLYDKVIKIDEDDAGINYSDFKDAIDEGIEEAFDEMDIDLDLDELGETEYDPELYDDVLKAITDSLTDSLDKDAMSKESDSIDVLGDEKKVTKYSYELNQKNLKKLVKNVAEELSDDDDFAKDLAKTLNVEKDDVEETLDSIKDAADEIEFDGKITINVYTSGLFNKIIGFDVKYSELKMSWYTNGDDVEAKIKFGDYYEINFEVKEGKATLSANDEKILTAKINSFTSESIDIEDIKFVDDEISKELVEGIIEALDFDDEVEEVKDLSMSIKLTNEESEISVNLDTTTEEGSISASLSLKSSESSISGEYKGKYEYDGKWLELSGDYSIKASSELDTFSTKDAVEADDIDTEKFMNNLKETVEKDKLFSLIYKTAMEESSITDVTTSDKTSDYDLDYDYDYDEDYFGEE